MFYKIEPAGLEAIFRAAGPRVNSVMLAFAAHAQEVTGVPPGVVLQQVSLDLDQDGDVDVVITVAPPDDEPG